MGRAVSRRNAGDWVEKRVAAFALPLPLKGFAQFAFYFRGSRGVDGGVCFFFFEGGSWGARAFGGVMGSGC